MNRFPFVSGQFSPTASVTTVVTIGDMNRSVRFPDELEARIRAVAVREERSFNWVVVRTLEKALGGLAEGAPVEGRGRREVGVEKAPSSPGSVSAPPRVSSLPGVVRASSLVKQGVRPIPKRGK